MQTVDLENTLNICSEFGLILYYANQKHVCQIVMVSNKQS